MSEQHYRAAAPQDPAERLTFYPALNLLSLAIGGALLLASLALIRARQPLTMTMPLLFGVLFYAIVGERHEVLVSDDDVRLRSRLWPLPWRERRILRSAIKKIHVEGFEMLDGEGNTAFRLVVETDRGERLALTSSYHRPYERAERLRMRLEALIFPKH